MIYTEMHLFTSLLVLVSSLTLFVLKHLLNNIELKRSG